MSAPGVRVPSPYWLPLERMLSLEQQARQELGLGKWFPSKLDAFQPPFSSPTLREEDFLLIGAQRPRGSSLASAEASQPASSQADVQAGQLGSLKH